MKITKTGVLIFYTNERTNAGTVHWSDWNFAPEPGERMPDTDQGMRDEILRQILIEVGRVGGVEVVAKRPPPPPPSSSGQIFMLNNPPPPAAS